MLDLVLKIVFGLVVPFFGLLLLTFGRLSSSERKILRILLRVPIIDPDPEPEPEPEPDPDSEPEPEPEPEYLSREYLEKVLIQLAFRISSLEDKINGDDVRR